jgi:hypothetical protein
MSLDAGMHRGFLGFGLTPKAERAMMWRSVKAFGAG